MKFLDYKVLNASFNLSTQGIPNGNYKIAPKLNCAIKHGGGKLFCTFTVELVKGADVIPFEFKVEAIGSFLVDAGEDLSIAAKKAAEAVYPLVRSSIATLTQSANVPPYMLPLLNIEELLSRTKPIQEQAPTPTTLS